MRDLRLLPKAHLHLHLEGAMRPSTLRELCERHDIPIPSIGHYNSFESYAECYFAACASLKTLKDFERLIFEVVEDAARDGAVWIEPSFTVTDSQKVLILQAGSDRALYEFVIDAGRRASKFFGVGFGLMISADRTSSPAAAQHHANHAVALAGTGVVAFGLANPELGYPPQPFKEIFHYISNAGLLSTPHAGEHAGAESIRGALFSLKANRILHGIRAVEDPELVQYLADSGTCLDVCPTSNVMLGVVNSVGESPLQKLLASGVRCSINADSPLLFGVGIIDEYENCRQELGLSDRQLADIARTSIECSAAPSELKLHTLKAIEQWITTDGISR